jgi:hypothetical protein
MMPPRAVWKIRPSGMALYLVMWARSSVTRRPGRSGPSPWRQVQVGVAEHDGFGGPQGGRSRGRRRTLPGARPDLAGALEFYDRWPPGTMRRITHITRTCIPNCVTLRSPATGLLVPDTANTRPERGIKFGHALGNPPDLLPDSQTHDDSPNE